MRNYFLDFNDFSNIDSLLNNFFNFIDLRYFRDSINDLLNNLRNDLKLSNCFLYCDNFFYLPVNFNYSILNVRDNFFNLFNSFLNDRYFNNFLNFEYNLFLCSNGYNFFYDFVNLLDLSMNNLNRSHLLNYSINGDLNFNRDNNVSIYFNYFWLLNNICDNFLNF